MPRGKGILRALLITACVVVVVMLLSLVIGALGDDDRPDPPPKNQLTQTTMPPEKLEEGFCTAQRTPEHRDLNKPLGDPIPVLESVDVKKNSSAPERVLASFFFQDRPPACEVSYFNQELESAQEFGHEGSELLLVTFESAVFKDRNIAVQQFSSQNTPLRSYGVQQSNSGVSIGFGLTRRVEFSLKTVEVGVLKWRVDLIIHDSV